MKDDIYRCECGAVLSGSEGGADGCPECGNPYMQPDSEKVAPCPCGSGEQRESIHDYRDIFLTYVCSKCKENKLKSYDPGILDGSIENHYEYVDEGW